MFIKSFLTSLALLAGPHEGKNFGNAHTFFPVQYIFSGNEMENGLFAKTKGNLCSISFKAFGIQPLKSPIYPHSCCCCWVIDHHHNFFICIVSAGKCWSTTFASTITTSESLEWAKESLKNRLYASSYSYGFSFIFHFYIKFSVGKTKKYSYFH